VARAPDRSAIAMLRCHICLTLLGAALLALSAASPAVAEDCGTPTVGFRVLKFTDRVAAVWYPTAASPAQYAYSPKFSGNVVLNAPANKVCGVPAPLVVFSHGDLGCGLQSIAFTEELARHGYVVAAPDHADAFLCHTARPEESGREIQPNFLKPETWTDTTFVGRRNDIEATIDELLSDDVFRQVIDATNIGAAGHSLGGYTVVGLVGGWSSWVDPRIRAVLALSPYVMPFQVRNTLQNIHVPLMYQGGTLDVGITPFLKGANGAYSQSNPPAYFVELNNAGHLAWVNCGKAVTTTSCLETQANMKLIDEYGIAFFERYLKHKLMPILTKKNPELADYEFKLPAD
jgi:predicted dienelactone hydrolase